MINEPKRLKPVIPKSTMNSIFRWIIVFISTAYLCIYNVTTSNFSLSYMATTQYWTSLGMTALFMVIIAFCVFDDYQTKTLFASRKIMVINYQIEQAYSVISKCGLSNRLDIFILGINKTAKFKKYIFKINKKLEKIKGASPLRIKLCDIFHINLKEKKKLLEDNLTLTQDEVWDKKTVKGVKTVYRSQLFSSLIGEIKYDEAYDLSSHKGKVLGTMVGKKLTKPIMITALFGLFASSAFTGGLPVVSVCIGIAIKLINIFMSIITARDGGIGYVLGNVLSACQSKHNLLSDFSQETDCVELKTVLNTTIDEFTFAE